MDHVHYQPKIRPSFKSKEPLPTSTQTDVEGVEFEVEEDVGDDEAWKTKKNMGRGFW